MMLLEYRMQMIARERHERTQEAEMANARQLAAGRHQQPNRPNRLRFIGRR